MTRIRMINAWDYMNQQAELYRERATQMWNWTLVFIIAGVVLLWVSACTDSSMWFIAACTVAMTALGLGVVATRQERRADRIRKLALDVLTWLLLEREQHNDCGCRHHDNGGNCCHADTIDRADKTQSDTDEAGGDQRGAD